MYVKNVSLNTLKLKYRQSNSKAFMMDFAETFTLRPGMSTPLKVYILRSAAAGDAVSTVEKCSVYTAGSTGT